MPDIENPYRSPRQGELSSANAPAINKTPRQIVMAAIFVGTMIGSLCGAVAAMLGYFGLFVLRASAAGTVGQIEQAVSELMATSILGALVGGASGVAVGLLIGVLAAWRVFFSAGFLRPASMIVWGAVGTAWGATLAPPLNSDESAAELLVAALIVAISTAIGVGAGMKFSRMLLAYVVE